MDQEQVEIVETELLRAYRAKAARASAGRWNPLLSLLVTNTSDRSMPEAATARPTSASLPYISAVSMWR